MGTSFNHVLVNTDTCFAVGLSCFSFLSCLSRVKYNKQKNKTKITRPSILCVTHQMSRKKRDYSVD